LSTSSTGWLLALALDLRKQAFTDSLGLVG
jgi:hypothetical protein